MLAWTGAKESSITKHRVDRLCRNLQSADRVVQTETNEIVSFTKLTDLRQGNLSLSEFINTA